MDAIACTEQYFERVGDKRPGIYLPTSLTEKRLYELNVGTARKKTIYLCKQAQQDLHERFDYWKG